MLLFTFGCLELSAPITTLSPMAMPRLASDTLSPPLLPEDDVSLCGGDLTCSLLCTEHNQQQSMMTRPLTIVAASAALLSMATGSLSALASMSR